MVSITEIVRVVPPTDTTIAVRSYVPGENVGRLTKCTDGEKTDDSREYFGATDDFDTPSNEQLHRGGDEDLQSKY